MTIVRRFAVELLGITSSILTAILVLLVQRTVGISIFTWFVWMFIPVGAMLCGFVSASGYFFGALRFERRPNWTLAVTMMVVGIGTYFLIYYLDYVTARLPVSFEDYVLIALTKARYVDDIDREGSEAGGFGFVIAALQIVGFMLGAGALFLKFRDLTACDDCDRFLRKVSVIEKRFPDDRSFLVWQNGIDRLDPASAEFEALLRKPVTRDRTSDGSVDTRCSLLACSGCDAQVMMQQSKMRLRLGWRPLPAYQREMILRRGVSLRRAFETSS